MITAKPDDMARVPADWREDVMIAAGASIISEVREEDGALAGYEVSPPITPDAYAAALKSWRPPVPAEVAALWLKAALAEAGKLDVVNAAAKAAGPVQATLWAATPAVRRDDPDVIAIAKAMKIDLDALFTRALALRDERATRA